MCNVPSWDMFCVESVEYFPGMASKIYFKPYVTVLVAPVITSIFIHFMFHVYYISIHKLLYFSLFYASSCVTLHLLSISSFRILFLQ